MASATTLGTAKLFKDVDPWFMHPDLQAYGAFCALGCAFPWPGRIPGYDLVTSRIVKVEDAFATWPMKQAYIVKQDTREAFLLDMLAHPDPYLANQDTVDPGSYTDPNSPGCSRLLDAELNPIRRAFRKNDLRNWIPKRPMLLCGVKGDQTVFFDYQTRVMEKYWTKSFNGRPPRTTGLLEVLDLSAPGGYNDPCAAARSNFISVQTDVKHAIRVVQNCVGTLSSAFWQWGDSFISSNLPAAYHVLGGVPCLNAERTFFSKVATEGR